MSLFKRICYTFIYTKYKTYIYLKKLTKSYISIVYNVFNYSDIPKSDRPIETY